MKYWNAPYMVVSLCYEHGIPENILSDNPVDHTSDMSVGNTKGNLCKHIGRQITVIAYLLYI